MVGMFEITPHSGFLESCCVGCNTERNPIFRGETADKMLFLKCSSCGADLFIDLKKHDLQLVKDELPFVADGYKILDEIKAAEKVVWQALANLKAEESWAQMRRLKVSIEKVDTLNNSLNCEHSFEQSGFGGNYYCKKCKWVDK